MIKRTENLKVD